MRSVECGVWSVEGKERSAVRSRLAFRLPPSALRTRPAFTLVELLITIMIITILAGLVLGVATVAGETAREQRSKHIVERLHTLLLEHADTFKTRRVKLRPAIEQGITNKYAKASDRGGATAMARLYALRELMMMEV